MGDALKLLPIERLRNPPPVVAVVRFDGVIGPRQWRGAVSLASHAGALDKAFALRRLSAVALAINSPGGSPVQSALLYRRIRQLAEEKGVPVFAFAEDVAASGGYWLALAGDEVYAEDASLLGSIGVVTSSFGLNRLIERFGIERRLHTAGENKALLDPFLPEDPADVARLTALQQDIHETFKEHVRRRRVGKIDAADETLFSGEVLTGRMALGARPRRRHRRSALGDAGAVRRQGAAGADRRGAPALVAGAAAARRRARAAWFPGGGDRRSPRLARSAGLVGPVWPVARLDRPAGLP